MIRSFAHKGLERFFTNGDKSGINAQYGDRISRVLDRLDSAIEATDMNMQAFTFTRLLVTKKAFTPCEYQVIGASLLSLKTAMPTL